MIKLDFRYLYSLAFCLNVYSCHWFQVTNLLLYYIDIYDTCTNQQIIYSDYTITSLYTNIISIQIFYWIKCIRLITQYPMRLHIRHSLCKCSPSITKDIKYNDKNK
jgi:hypothetical protein